MSNNNSKEWFVVYTKPAKESYAGLQLRMKDINVFCPFIKEHYWRNGRIEERVKALFPGYIFVNILLEEEYYKVKWTPGVKRFVGCGSKPVPIKDDILQFIKGLTDKQGLINRRRLKKGDRVRIKSGPLRDLIGIVENDVSPVGRVKVLMELVNYSARVEIPEVLVEAI